MVRVKKLPWGIQMESKVLFESFMCSVNPEHLIFHNQSYYLKVIVGGSDWRIFSRKLNHPVILLRSNSR